VNPSPKASFPTTQPPKILFERALNRTRQVVRGKDAVVELALVAIIAGGHVLVEDVPGVGKTTLASTLAIAIGGSFSRIQFTSDLLPGDITGVNFLDAERSDFRFRKGPVFANVVLADEINRASPKTQSALLEAMGEQQVTVDGTGHPLPAPFVVLATQNPHDFHGTFPLPESQLDRFLIRLSMGYPDRESEREILRAGGPRRLHPEPALTLNQTRSLVRAVDDVAVSEAMEDVILDLVRRTRADARLRRGASTRGTEALYRACRAHALVRGRDHVIPEDAARLAVPVLAHRVGARQASGTARAAAEQAVGEICDELMASLGAAV